MLKKKFVIIKEKDTILEKICLYFQRKNKIIKEKKNL